MSEITAHLGRALAAAKELEAHIAQLEAKLATVNRERDASIRRWKNYADELRAQIPNPDDTPQS
jgi:uncharacterized protein YhaN